MQPLFTRAFVLASCVHFLHSLAFALYLHIAGFLKAVGATEVRIGVIVGTTGLTAILSRPWLGRAMDLRGRRIVFLVGGGAHAIICALYLTVTALGPWVYAVRIAHGLAEAMIFASMFAVAADLVPSERRIQGIALFGVSGMLPMAFSGVLGDILVGNTPTASDYTRLFHVATVFASAGFLCSLWLRDAPRVQGEAPRRFYEAVTQRDLLPLWGTGLCFSTAICAYFTFMKVYVAHTGVGSVGVFFATYSIAAIALRVLFGSVPDRFGPKNVLLPALVSLAAGLIVLGSARSALAIGAAGILAGAGHGFAFPILLGFVVQRARATERGAALAVYTSLFDAGTLLGGPSLGAIAEYAGFPAMFRAAAALVVLGAIGFVLAERRLGASPAHA